MRPWKLFLPVAVLAAAFGLMQIGRTTPRASAPVVHSTTTTKTSDFHFSDEAPATEEFPGITTPAFLPVADSVGLIDQWHGRLIVPLIDRAPAPDADLHLPLRFSFPVSESRQIRVRIDRHDELDSRSGNFIGETEDPAGGVVILSYVGLAQAGVLQFPAEQRAYVINGDQYGHVRVTAFDLRQAPGCTDPLVPPNGHTSAIANTTTLP